MSSKYKVSLKSLNDRMRATEHAYEETQWIEDHAKRVAEQRHLIKLAHDLSERIELEESNAKLLRAMEGNVVEIERVSLGAEETASDGAESN